MKKMMKNMKVKVMKNMMKKYESESDENMMKVKVMKKMMKRPSVAGDLIILEKDNQFWKITKINNLSFKLQYGKKSKKGYSQIKNFDSNLDLEKYIKKAIKSKIQKGYSQIKKF